MKAAVLGYGPAGLIAAKTLVDEGIDVDVIGAGGKSVIGGAQYLHEPILNAEHVTEPEGHIEFVKIGDRDGYAEKIYPDASFQVSWDNYEGCQPAWALGPVYDILWGYFQDRLIHDTLEGMSLVKLHQTGKYDIIFSSIPAHALCLGIHAFPRVSIKLVPWSPIEDLNNVVMYSGRESETWYRTSVIFGEAWSEYGGAATARTESRLGFKPLGTNCDCHPYVVRIGRFGLWDRKILLHHVPHQVRAALKERAVI